MLGQNNQISELEDIMVRNDLFKKFRLSKLGIFGSAARGEVSNDIDILIEDNVDYRSLSVFRDELQKLTNKRIDIVVARYANPIVANAEIIFGSQGIYFDIKKKIGKSKEGAAIPDGYYLDLKFHADPVLYFVR